MAEIIRGAPRYFEVSIAMGYLKILAIFFWERLGVLKKKTWDLAKSIHIPMAIKKTTDPHLG